MRVFSLLIAAAAVLPAHAVNTLTDIFDPQFKSLQVTNPDNLLGFPILELANEASRMHIGFDELAEDNRFLRYRLLHCDSNWRPTPISDMEFASGFNQGDIYSYALSEKTLTHYVHYDLMLPNEDVQPLLSGNYLVEIFDQDDPDDVLLQARFMVSEGVAQINAAVTSRTDIDYNDRHQQLGVNVNLDGTGVTDPYNDLTLVIIQNGRPDMRRTLAKPLRATPQGVAYEHQKELIFPAGNEYRRFDIANVRYPGMRVERYDYIEPFYQAMLQTDVPRPYARYQYDEDQSGRYFVDELNATEPDINSDYVMTYFTLQMPRIDEDVFIDGDVVLRKHDSDARMVYDDSLGAYIKTMLLKQGMYNYQYVTSSVTGLNPIEGDHYETGNEYLILLYHSAPGARYERLIGSSVIYSGK